MIYASRSVAPSAIRVLGVVSSRRDAVCRYSTSPNPPHFNHTSYELSTEDKFEIMEVCHRFDQVLNLGQQERLGSFFSSDAVVNIDMSNPKVPLRAVKGVQPILEYFQSVKQMAAGNRHLTCNIVVEPDGLRAAKVTAYRLLHKAQNPPVLLAAGMIEDKLVNENGEWKFAVRNFIMDPPAPTMI
ncbi:hypothetical protein OEZ85_004427 [Tetradesmus obliquus]|uniref:SnoaL-like domain-containing protein n=1 Tax=Tetradesmus obliquus TaxID=3088 RepID=A0ABY8UM49_TETOB|nr:hypothetical protein OEZ85_004427 [Tetradesmus obliquus]